MLVESGAALDMQSSNGDTALILAAEAGHTAVVEMLCSAEAALNIRDRDDDSALSLALAHGNAGATRALVQAGASLARLSAEQLRIVVRLLGQTG